MSDEFGGVSLDDLAASAQTAPNGEYEVLIVAAEGKNTKTGGGKYINYRVTIQSGPYAGFSFYNMWSTKPSAGKQDTTYMTRGDWSRLGLNGFKDVSELVGVRGIAKIEERLKKDEAGEVTEEKENRIKKWIKAV